MPPRKPTGIMAIITGASKTVTTYRAASLFLLLSLTPLAKPLWAHVGLTADDANTAPTLDRIDHRLEKVEDKVDRLDNRVQNVSSRVTGFQIDFNKYKETHP